MVWRWACVGVDWIQRWFAIGRTLAVKLTVPYCAILTIINVFLWTRWYCVAQTFGTFRVNCYSCTLPLTSVCVTTWTHEQIECNARYSLNMSMILSLSTFAIYCVYRICTLNEVCLGQLCSNLDLSSSLFQQSELSPLCPSSSRRAAYFLIRVIALDRFSDCVSLSTTSAANMSEQGKVPHGYRKLINVFVILTMLSPCHSSKIKYISKYDTWLCVSFIVSLKFEPSWHVLLLLKGKLFKGSTSGLLWLRVNH